jgi:cytochrome c oxidase subunit 3
MSAMLLFLAIVASIGGWWLSRQRLMAKPWLEEGALGEFPGTGASTMPAAKIGLGVLLAVVGCLFALLISAYIIRIDGATPTTASNTLPVSNLLWVNSGLLVLSSIALQAAWLEVRRGRADDARVDLLAGAASALAFVAGQLLVWRQLAQSGALPTSTPALAFFYLLTGVHGLHVAAGLAALGRSIARVWRGAAIEEVRQGIELCAIYWHFLLLIWLVLFALVMGWTDGILDICRAILP